MASKFDRERQLKLSALGLQDVLEFMPQPYADLFINVKREMADLRVRNDKAILDMWTEAAEQISVELKGAKGLRKEQLKGNLLDLLLQLNTKYSTLLTQDIMSIYTLVFGFQSNIIWSILSGAGFLQLGPVQFANIYTGMAQTTAEAFLARKTKGVPLSKRIWQANQGPMNTIIDAAMSGNLSAYDIAPALEKYLINGSNSLAVGESQALMKAFDGRLPKDMKYNAFRTARTEISNAFAHSVYESGARNPFYDGIIWRLSNRHDEKLKCQCKQLVGFHEKGKEPPLPHPNCMCQQLPQMDDMDAAIDEAIGWVNDPKSNPKLETWYSKNIVNK